MRGASDKRQSFSGCTASMQMCVRWRRADLVLVCAVMQQSCLKIGQRVSPMCAIQLLPMDASWCSLMHALTDVAATDVGYQQLLDGMRQPKKSLQLLLLK
jgi:hypothetical protein